MPSNSLLHLKTTFLACYELLDFHEDSKLFCSLKKKGKLVTLVACLLGVLNVRLKYRYQCTAHTAEVCFGLKLQEGTTRPRVNKVVKRLLICELYNG